MYHQAVMLSLALAANVNSFPTLLARQAGTPSCPTGDTQNVTGPCTTVEVFDQKISWGNALPQDTIAWLNKPKGACYQQTTCTGKKQGLPTQIITSESSDAEEQWLQFEVSDAEFPPDNNGEVRDAMFNALQGALAVGVDTVPTKYSTNQDEWHFTHSTMNQNFQTNEVNVQYYKDGDMKGWIHVQISLGETGAGHCGSFNKDALSYAQDGVIALSSVPVAGAFLVPVIGILGAVNTACAT